jgi:hypothetical protein
MEASCDVSAASLPDVPRPSARAGAELHVLIVRFILVFLFATGNTAVFLIVQHDWFGCSLRLPFERSTTSPDAGMLSAVPRRREMAMTCLHLMIGRQLSLRLIEFLQYTLAYPIAVQHSGTLTQLAGARKRNAAQKRSHWTLMVRVMQV